MFALYCGDLGGSWYAGKNYIYQGGFFPSICEKEGAKRYSSRKRAENAAKAVAERTGVSFDVIDLS